MSAFLLLFVLSTFGLDWKHRISQRSKEMNLADRRNLGRDYEQQNEWEQQRVAGVANYYSVVGRLEQDPAVAMAVINHYLESFEHRHQNFLLTEFDFWQLYHMARVAFPTFESSPEFQHVQTDFSSPELFFHYLQTDTSTESALGTRNLDQNLDQVLQALESAEPEITEPEITSSELSAVHAAYTGGVAPIGDSFGSAVENAQCAQFDDTCSCALFGHFLHCVDCECQVFEELFQKMDNPQDSMTELLDDDYCHETDSHCECHLGVEESKTDESVTTAAVTCVNCSCEEFTSLLGMDRRNLHETNSLKEEPKMLKRSNVLRKL